MEIARASAALASRGGMPDDLGREPVELPDGGPAGDAVTGVNADAEAFVVYVDGLEGVLAPGAKYWVSTMDGEHVVDVTAMMVTRTLRSLRRPCGVVNGFGVSATVPVSTHDSFALVGQASWRSSRPLRNVHNHEEGTSSLRLRPRATSGR